MESERDVLYIMSHRWLCEETYITTIPEHTLDSYKFLKDNPQFEGIAYTLSNIAKFNSRAYLDILSDSSLSERS